MDNKIYMKKKNLTIWDGVLSIDILYKIKDNKSYLISWKNYYIMLKEKRYKAIYKI